MPAQSDEYTLHPSTEISLIYYMEATHKMKGSAISASILYL